MKYTVNPGLYAVGTPDQGSPVLVTANYKLTFDALRKELHGLDAWLLVLDTKGINVWCAAGKGTFGTEELLVRLGKAKLAQVVSHRTLILPQLGAPGISAQTVMQYSGFRVVYGPVKARDIKEYLQAGLQATAQMRAVTFDTYERLVLIPIELTAVIKPSLMIFGVLFMLNVAGLGPFGMIDFDVYLGTIIAGCVLTPLLLPWIPGRSFAWKGYLLGLLWILFVNMQNGWPGVLSSYSWLRAVGYLLVLPPVAAYLGLNFTGASTYTSLSGVMKEMKIAIPAMIVSIIAGAFLILVNNLMRL